MAAPKRCCSCGPPTSVKTIVSALIGHDHAAPPELPAPAVSGPRRERRNGNAPLMAATPPGSIRFHGIVTGGIAALNHRLMAATALGSIRFPRHRSPNLRPHRIVVDVA